MSALSLLGADAILFAAASVLASMLREIYGGPVPQPWGVASGGLAWLALRWHFGLYSGSGMQAPEELRRSTNSAVLAALCHCALLFALKETEASRFIALGTWLLVLPMSWVARSVVKGILVRLRLYGRPAVVLGAGETGRLIVRELRGDLGIGLTPVAFYDDDPRKVGTFVEGVPVLGTLDDAERVSLPYQVRDAILAMPGVGGQRQVQLARRLAARFPHFSIVPDLFGYGNLWVEAKAAGSCLTLVLRHERFDAKRRMVKRAFDLAVGLPLFLITAPLVGLAALLVKLISPGPAFFAQLREGIDGRPIRIWKIRTMVPDAEDRLNHYLDANDTARLEWERCMKLQHDPRVIRFVGRFLRQSSFDELPQLWNVIRGDLSLVGPRPFPPYHLQRFPGDFLELRRQVPPGMTGYWQVMHRSDSDLRRQEAADSYYVHNWSLWLDLWILVRTVRVVLNGSGAY